MDKDFFLLGEVAREVGCKPYQLAYLLSTGVIEEPQLRLGTKRVFNRLEVDRIGEIVRQRGGNAEKEAHAKTT